jgi:hypothetical protein
MDYLRGSADADVVSETVEVRVGRESAKRLRRTAEEKRRIVEATLVPGASIARVAREHGVNANQVFQWRHEYRKGALWVWSMPSNARFVASLSVYDARSASRGLVRWSMTSIHFSERPKTDFAASRISFSLLMLITVLNRLFAALAASTAMRVKRGSNTLVMASEGNA